MKKYHIITFGCQMNISDSERIASVLESLKYKPTSKIIEADLILVTMCSVRQTAVDRVYGLAQKFKKIKKTNKNLKTILTGCVLKKDKKKFTEIFDYVIDIKEAGKLPEFLAGQQILERSYSDYLKIAPKYSNKFSASVPIMTGCNNFCSYCVVPYARDREISRPAEEIICEIKNLVNLSAVRGYKEIWLLGQNVNSYKNDNINFPKLLKMINNIPGNFWIRFTSSHPKDFSDELIGTMANCKKVTPYLNLPVQSGDDKILKLMNRHYTVLQYKNIIKKIRKAVPNIALSTDIIVGFPGETKKQFENTVKLFKDIKFDMAYINKYSPRPETAAAKMKDNVSPQEKKEREKILTEILKQTALSHNKKLVGKTLTVLVDSNRGNFLFGKSGGYKTVKINIKHPESKTQNLVGQFLKVKIIKAQEWALGGILQ